MQIGIRAIEYSRSTAVGHRITFELIEPNPEVPSGATLAARQADTNEFGVASITVTAGDRPAFFSCACRPTRRLALTYDINVVLPPPGSRARRRDPPPVDPGMLGTECRIDVQGGYRVTNRYEPARLIGDGFANSVQQINDALSDPGGFVGDLIRDRIDGIWGAVIRTAIRPVVNYLFDYVLTNFAPTGCSGCGSSPRTSAQFWSSLRSRARCSWAAPTPTAHSSGIHRWDKLVLFWRAPCDPGNAQCGRHEVPLNQLGIAASETNFTARITRNIANTADMTHRRPPAAVEPGRGHGLVHPERDPSAATQREQLR